jgi:toxin CcdB
MARFDVYRNPNALTAKRFPYLLAVQSDILADLATQIVVPLGKSNVVANRPADRLTPLLDVDGETLVMFTPELGPIPQALLRKQVANLESQRDRIRDALDFLFSGY